MRMSSSCEWKITGGRLEDEYGTRCRTVTPYTIDHDSPRAHQFIDRAVRHRSDDPLNDFFVKSRVAIEFDWYGVFPESLHCLCRQWIGSPFDTL